MRTSFAFGLSAFVALCSWSSSFAAAKVVSFDWHVTQFNASFDGVSRPVIGINGRPAHEFLIEITLGDTIEVTVTNDLDTGTSLHWHGIPQATSPDQDGSPASRSAWGFDALQVQASPRRYVLVARP